MTEFYRQEAQPGTSSPEGASQGPTLRTERLVLRPWKPADRASFAELNADPEVMEYIGEPLSREESDALADRIEAHRRDGIRVLGGRVSPAARPSSA